MTASEPQSGGPAPTTVALLVLALVGLPLGAAGLDALGVDGPGTSVLVPWSVLAVVLAGAVGVEDRSLGSIGLRRPALRDAGWAVVTAGLALVAIAATDPLLEALGLATTDGLDYGTGLAAGLAIAVTAGVVEETLLRGYALERLAETDFGVTGAAVLTWLVFPIAHLPAGVPSGTLLQIAAGGAVFTAVYVRRRTLAPVVAGHAGVNALGVLASTLA